MVVPDVSVLLPVFNAERYLDQAIQSVLEQQGISLELIAINDASTDETGGILREWAKRDARVRLVELSENRGASHALNAGFGVAAGRYIARQDADDVSMPGRLAAQVATLDREKDLVLLGTNYLLVDSAGRVLALANHAESSSVLSFLLNFWNSLGVPGQGMFRTETARAVGGFSREFRYAQGYELWTRLAMRGRVAVLPMIGLKYRVHDESTSALHERSQIETAVEVSRRQLSATLGRTVKTDEARAVFGRWRETSCEPVSRQANAVITEAWDAWLRADPTMTDRTRARILVATRFARSAVDLMRRKRFAEAVVCTNIAAAWHPSGLAGVVGAGAAKLRRNFMASRRIM